AIVNGQIAVETPGVADQNPHDLLIAARKGRIINIPRGYRRGQTRRRGRGKGNAGGVGARLEIAIFDARLDVVIVRPPAQRRQNFGRAIFAGAETIAAVVGAVDAEIDTGDPRRSGYTGRRRRCIEGAVLLVGERREPVAWLVMNKIDRAALRT